MTEKKPDDANKQANEPHQLATPYGPQPHGIDQAAGGADSSPYDNQPTGERVDSAKEARREGPAADKTDK